MACGRGFKSPQLHHIWKSQLLSVGIFFAYSPSETALSLASVHHPVPPVWVAFPAIFSLCSLLASRAFATCYPAFMRVCARRVRNKDWSGTSDRERRIVVSSASEQLATTYGSYPVAGSWITRVRLAANWPLHREIRLATRWAPHDDSHHQPECNSKRGLPGQPLLKRRRWKQYE